MREIKFRGKRIDNGEWEYGFYYEHQPPLQCIIPKDYVTEKSKHYIAQTGFADWHMPRPIDFLEVIPGTVGQYTGRKDKNGLDIYEGDTICQDTDDLSLKDRYCVRWNENLASFMAYFYPEDSDMLFLDDVIPETYSVIIGNIYDNKEETPDANA